MDQRFTLIPALTSRNADSTILVRATRIWESINRDTKQVFHTNVILLDQEDNHIVATVRNTQKRNCFPLIAEGKVYEISNVKVVSATQKFRAVDRDVSLTFFHKTQIKPTGDTALIPRHKFELTPLENVAHFINQTTALIDVIGMVTDYGNLEMAANGAQKMDLLMVNDRQKSMTVTLWEEKAQQFQDALQAIEGVPIFAVISGLLAKNFAGTPALSSSDATKSFLNIDYSPLNTLKDAVVAAMGKSLDLLPPPTKRNFIAAGATNLHQLSIQQILDYNLPAGEKVARCICHATIIGILEGEGWFYYSCPDCGHKVRARDQNYYCTHCAQIVDNVKQRYMLIVRVQDPTGSTTFTLFNKEVERLLHVPVESLTAEFNQGNPIAELPPVVNNVVGKTCAFEVKINSFNTNLGYEEYTIVKLSEIEPAENAGGAGNNESVAGSTEAGGGGTGPETTATNLGAESSRAAAKRQKQNPA